MIPNNGFQYFSRNSKRIISMNRKLKFYIIALLLIMIPAQAIAATSVTCNGFTLQDTTIPTVAQCESNLSLDTVISSSICLIRAVMAEAMFEIYCGLLDQMDGIIVTALALWVIFYTISVMFGISNASPRDIVIRIMKIMFILTFALNAEVFFVYMYQFFHNLLNGISLFLLCELNPSTLHPGNPNAPNIVNCSDDVEIQKQGVFAHLDNLLFAIIGDNKLNSLAALTVSFLNSGGVPSLLLVIALVIGMWAMVMAFFRILMTYAMAIVALNFVMMFAPLFFAFALFERTADLFRGWLASLISYVIQPIIVLAFIFLFAGVSDLSGFIEDARVDQAGVEKIEFNERVFDAIVFQLSGETWRHKKLTGDPNTEDATEFKVDFRDTMYFALAFLILNLVLSSFLQRVPVLAQMLARFESHAATPDIAGGNRSPMYTPEKFVTQSAVWKSAEGSFAKGVGGTKKAVGKIFDPGVKRSGATRN